MMQQKILKYLKKEILVSYGIEVKYIMLAFFYYMQGSVTTYRMTLFCRISYFFLGIFL